MKCVPRNPAYLRRTLFLLAWSFVFSTISLGLFNKSLVPRALAVDCITVGNGEGVWVDSTQSTDGALDGKQFNEGGITSLSHTIKVTNLPSPGSAEFRVQADSSVLVTVPIDVSTGQSTISWSQADNDLAFKLYVAERLQSYGIRRVIYKDSNRECVLGSYRINDLPKTCNGTFSFVQERTIDGEVKQCSSFGNAGCLEVGKPIQMKGSVTLTDNGQPLAGQKFFLQVLDPNRVSSRPIWFTSGPDGIVDITTNLDIGVDNPMTHIASFETELGELDQLHGNCEYIPIQVRTSCNNLCSLNVTNEDATGDVNFSLCSQVAETGAAKASCDKCAADKGIWTAIGCIKTEPQSIVLAVVQIGVGIGGGIALLMTLIGGFLLTTSEGDPKRTQEGKDMITSAVIGIIFILFSVVILQFIGVTVLQLPGFGVAPK